MEYQITGPDGREYRVTAPEGATEAQVLAFVQREVKSPTLPQGEPAPNPKIAAAEVAAAEKSPFIRSGDSFIRGMGRAIPFFDDAAALFDATVGRGEGDTFGERYKDSLGTRRAGNEVEDRDRPGMSYGGQVAGAAMLPVGPLLKSGASLYSKVKAGAKIGGAYGALQGLGSGDSAKDRFLRGLTGGAVGAGVGAAIPPVVAGAGKIIAPAVNAARGIANPVAEASRRVYDTITKAVREGRGLSNQELATAIKADSPLVLGDVGGEPTRALARSAANTSPEGREVLQEVAGTRFAEQSGRTATFIQNLMGGKFDPAQFTTWLQQRARTRNKPLYDAAEREADAVAARMPDGLWNDDLAKLAQSPTFQKAMLDSVPRGADRAVAQGGQPSKAPFVLDKDGNLTLAPPDKNGSRSLPSLSYWDNVKRELDAKIIALTQDGDKSGAATAKTLRKQLVDLLDSVAPSYKKARASAASYFGAEDALEAGQAFVGMTKSADLVGARKAVAQMTSTERALFAQGYAAELAASVERIGDNANVPTRAVFNNPLARQKMQLALGPQRARELEDFLVIERTMDRLRGALGNSTTARQLAELGLAGGVGVIGSVLTGDVTDGTTAGTATYVARALFGAARGRIDRKVAQHVAEMLASNDPQLLQKAYTIIRSSPALQQTMDSLDTMLAKVSGTQAAPDPAVQ